MDEMIFAVLKNVKKTTCQYYQYIKGHFSLIGIFFFKYKWYSKYCIENSWNLI